MKEKLDITKLYRGMKVKYSFPKNGYEGDRKMCEKYLKKNKVYKIEHFDIHGWSTTVYLEGVYAEVDNGNVSFRLAPFNSISFSEVKSRKTKGKK